MTGNKSEAARILQLEAFFKDIGNSNSNRNSIATVEKNTRNSNNNNNSDRKSSENNNININNNVNNNTSPMKKSNSEESATWDNKDQEEETYDRKSMNLGDYNRSHSFGLDPNPDESSHAGFPFPFPSSSRRSSVNTVGGLSVGSADDNRENNNQYSYSGNPDNPDNPGSQEKVLTKQGSRGSNNGKVKKHVLSRLRQSRNTKIFLSSHEGQNHQHLEKRENQSSEDQSSESRALEEKLKQKLAGGSENFINLKQQYCYKTRLEHIEAIKDNYDCKPKYVAHYDVKKPKAEEEEEEEPLEEYLRNRNSKRPETEGEEYDDLEVGENKTSALIKLILRTAEGVEYEKIMMKPRTYAELNETFSRCFVGHNRIVSIERMDGTCVNPKNFRIRDNESIYFREFSNPTRYLPISHILSKRPFNNERVAYLQYLKKLPNTAINYGSIQNKLFRELPPGRSLDNIRLERLINPNKSLNQEETPSNQSPSKSKAKKATKSESPKTGGSKPQLKKTLSIGSTGQRDEPRKKTMENGKSRLKSIIKLSGAFITKNRGSKIQIQKK